MKHILPTIILGATSALAFPFADPKPCAPLKHSTGPEPSPNTLEGFQHFEAYSKEAKSAATPHGYERIVVDSDGAIKSDKFMTFHDLDHYNTEKCAHICSTTRGCDSFNVYFLRNPSVEPAQACPNPKANVLTRCGLYSEPVEASHALNRGQVRGPPDAHGEAFKAAIRGSNAYNRVANHVSRVTVTVTPACTQVATKTITVTKAKST